MHHTLPPLGPDIPSWPAAATDLSLLHLTNLSLQFSSSSPKGKSVNVLSTYAPGDADTLTQFREPKVGTLLLYLDIFHSHSYCPSAATTFSSSSNPS